MIYEVFNLVSERLNSHFGSKFSLNDEKRVVVSNLVNQDGTLTLKETDKVVMSLVGMEKENIIGTSRRGGGVPTVNINLYILFVAYFNGLNYPEALKFISGIISFFQANSVFSHQNSPNLDVDIEKLTFEFVNLTFQEQNNLWAMMGCKYLPSVLYKVRMVAFQEGTMSFSMPGIGSI